MITDAVREAVDESRNLFNRYAALDGDMLPSKVDSANFDWVSDLQVKLARWQVANFGAGELGDLALGVAEEAGELCHAVLKHKQGIRGMHGEDFRAAAGDAIADCMIYLFQVATSLRLDVPSLLSAIAHDVMSRNWRANPSGQGI